MLILASQSPRRAELLQQLKVPFRTCAVEIDESVLPGEKPADYVNRLALEKARSGQQGCDEQTLVLGSDTSVVVDDQILGKPRDKQDFQQVLRLLSGRFHQVYTAVAIVKGTQVRQCLVQTTVEFTDLSDAAIEWYWHTGEPQDKAGSYGIQGLGGQFVTRIDGSYSAVVGLPLYETSQLLSEMGMNIYER